MGKVKVLTKEEIATIKNDLTNKQSAKRRSAAKKIGKFLLLELAESLFDAYLIEKEDVRTWETQKEMIKALGRLKYNKLLPHVEQIVNNNLEFDMITIEASTAFIRLKRKSGQDISAFYELFKKGKHSVLLGAVYSLMYDDVIPSNEDIKKLIKTVNDSYHPEEPGVFDTRRVLACVMSKWPKELVSPYLEEYRSSKGIPQVVIDYALKGIAYCAPEY